LGVDFSAKTCNFKVVQSVSPVLPPAEYKRRVKSTYHRAILPFATLLWSLFLLQFCVVLCRSWTSLSFGWGSQSHIRVLKKPSTCRWLNSVCLILLC